MSPGKLFVGKRGHQCMANFSLPLFVEGRSNLRLCRQAEACLTCRPPGYALKIARPSIPMHYRPYRQLSLADSSPINFRMHGMPLRRLFESQRDAQRRGFIIEAAREHDRLRQVLSRCISGGRDINEAAGNTNGWMAR